jgi:hypothetical protein
MTASYRLLVPHWIEDAYLEANTIVTEGVNIPVGWKPTLGCEPLNSAGLSAFAAQPPGLCPLIQSQFSNNVVSGPTTAWVGTPQAEGCTKWQLTGLGASLAPIFA